MLRDGMENLNMDALAKEAKIAKGTLYLYFKNKEAVLSRLTVQAREQLSYHFTKAANEQEDPLDQIRAIFWVHFNFFTKKRLYYDLMAFYEFNRHLEETEELLISSQNIHAAILTILERAKSLGAVKEQLDTATFSMMIWGMSVGITQLIDTKTDLIQMHAGKNAEEFYKNFVELTIAGIRA